MLATNSSPAAVELNLMLHPWPIVSGYVADTLDGGRGPINSMRSKQFYETDPARGFVRGGCDARRRGEGPPILQAWIIFESLG